MSAAAEYWERDGRHAVVAAVWGMEAQADQTSLVSADGCFDFILRQPARGARAAFVYTPVTAAHQVHVQSGDRLFGVRVRPGFGGVLTKHQPELARLAEREAESALSSGSSSHERPDAPTLLERLEAWVVSAVTAATPPDIVREFVSLAQASAGRHRLTSPSTGAAERELQRACERWLGLSPQSFLRIERAWATRRAIRNGRPLASVAADLNYADQAHMTRELHLLLGVTPGELRPVGILQDSIEPRR